ncbi:MAG TPA: response regulator [Actinomycetota bacterium]|nr:response regulator [Actinomycetota bacterium]
MLVVEDDPASAELVGYLIRGAGHRLSVCTRGSDMAGALRTDPPDLILVDQHLPDMDGVQALTLLRSNPATPDVPVVALTAAAQPEDRARLLAAGFDDYLAKPIEPTSFMRSLDPYLARSGRRPEGLTADGGGPGAPVRDAESAAVPAYLIGVWWESLEAILSRLGRLKAASTAASEGRISPPQRSEAEAEAHKLAGVLGTFGLGHGSHLARDLEGLLGGVSPLEGEAASHMRTLVEELEAEIRRGPRARAE